MAVGKRKANIHINIILTLLYRVWCGSIAMGEGTSNKCHYKRAWDWRAPAILTIQSAECSQENVNKRERLCWLGLTLLFYWLCSVDVDGWIICCDSCPAAGHRDVRFQQEVCTKLRSRSLFGPHHVCMALFHCTDHTNKNIVFLKMTFKVTMCHEEEIYKTVCTTHLTTSPRLITTLQTLHPFSCDEW